MAGNSMGNRAGKLSIVLYVGIGLSLAFALVLGLGVWKFLPEVSKFITEGEIAKAGFTANELY